jgi:hypothetical protein
MFAKLMGYKALLDRADGEIVRTRNDLAKASAEVRRLTDIIIHLKREGMTLDPTHSDDRWAGGRYSFDEIEAEGQPTFSERETSLADKELQAELEEALGS